MKIQTYRPSASPATEGIRGAGRPRLLWPLLGLLGLLSCGGFIGGLSFVRDRTGADLGAKLSWLQNTPVDDYLLPGLFLLAVYGIGSMLLMAGWGGAGPRVRSVAWTGGSATTGRGSERSGRALPS